jgi:hypothetical protein
MCPMSHSRAIFSFDGLLKRLVRHLKGLMTVNEEHEAYQIVALVRFQHFLKSHYGIYIIEEQIFSMSIKAIRDKHRSHHIAERFSRLSINSHYRWPQFDGRVIDK